MPLQATATLALLCLHRSTTAMFGASALYHRPTWQPKARAFFRRLDHAAIFLLIAGRSRRLAVWCCCCCCCPLGHAAIFLLIGGRNRDEPCCAVTWLMGALPALPPARTALLRTGARHAAQMLHCAQRAIIVPIAPLSPSVTGTNTPLALVALPVEQVRHRLLAGYAVSAELLDATGSGQLVAEGRCVPSRLSHDTATPSPAHVQSTRLLSIVWGGALTGIAQCMLFAHAPKALGAGL